MTTEKNKVNETEKSLKTLLRLFLVLFLIAAAFVVGAVIFMALYYLFDKGWNEKGFDAAGRFLERLLKRQPLLWEAYVRWWKVLWLSWKNNRMNGALFIPFLTPILFVGATVLAFIKSSYSFKLWYKISNRYAKLTDIRDMGLLDGQLMALGKFENYILRLKRCFSVLCLGESGSGKTTGVAIPSILESDKACIVAVDCCNDLAGHTIGYRARLGKVFYFNWNLTDEPLKNEFYPRWNPLSSKDMPEKGEVRARYLSGLSRYFIANSKDKDVNSYWERLSVLAMDGILNFFIAKVEQACANDYFLSALLERGKLSKDDRDILLSYYLLMSKKYALPIIENLELGKLDMENYLPIGSWEGVPKAWQGKEINFAMFSDWLLQSYFAVKSLADKPDIDGWKILIERWIEEAEFFGYNEKSLEILRQLFCLSRKQRGIIFPMLINPLSIFRNSNVRERTSASDFYMFQSRGIKNPETNQWEVVTIYSISGNKSLDFISKLFVDMLIDSNINPAKGYGPYPLLFVMDNIEQQPRYDSLIEGLIHGSHAKMSFLLLSDYMKMLHEKYGTEALEEIVSNAAYKMMMADNCKTAAQKFENLAIYGTKSVQIPAGNMGSYLRNKSGLTDANYYRIIANNLNSEKKYKLEVGDEFLVASGYYHLPIRMKCLYFLDNENLKNKAAIDACYNLPEAMARCRNVQDVETPALLTVLHDAGLNIGSDEDVDIYLEDKFEEAMEKRQVLVDKESTLADDISNRWKSSKPQATKDDDSEWWLEEEAFCFSIHEDETNPFK